MDGEQLREWLHPPTGNGRVNSSALSARVRVSRFSSSMSFPMPQKSGFRRSFRLLVKRWIRVLVCLCFPKGNGQSMEHWNPFMPGTGLLIQKLGAPVVPMRNWTDCGN